jgi:hypothetical protein
MLPQDPGSALVRISGDQAGPYVGTGFICVRGDDTLILTCRRVIDAAIEDAATRKVWIDGACEATSIFEILDRDGGELAVLRCADLPKRNVLLLRPGLPAGETRIFGYYDTWPDKPRIHPYKRRSEKERTIRMSNDPEQSYRIHGGHFGSPVLDDENWVVAVVTGVDTNTSRDRSETDAIVVAGRADQLMEWEQRPPYLFSFQEIFISYSREDGEVVERVAAALRRDGFGVWLDVQMIEAGDNWIEKLTDILKSTRFALLFCSPSSRSRPWVKHEIELLQTRLSSPDRPLVLPVVLRGGDVPFELGNIQYIDLADENINRCVADVRQAIAKHQTRAVPVVRDADRTADVPG